MNSPGSNATEAPAPRQTRGRLPWSRRTLLLVLPLHLVAFVALYFGTVGVVEHEILAAHSRDAALLLDQAVRDMHPSMVSHDAAQVRSLLKEFVADHRILDLRLYDENGRPVGHDEPPDPETMAMLSQNLKGHFRFSHEDGRITLDGRMRIPLAPACTACHTSTGDSLGAATMRLDMTESLSGAQRRLRVQLALLVVGWAALVGALNVVLIRVARRSIARLQLGYGSQRPADQRRSAVPRAILDPVSEQLLGSLADVMRREREHAAEVSSHLQDTERLASLGQLAAGLAHEIKNPLAGVHGALELLREEAPASSHDVYDQMLAELDRVNTTIHALLNFARPSRPNRTPTDVAALLDNAVRLLRPALQRRDIALEVSAAPNMPAFSFDPFQIRQVLVNLVTNAADAIERHGKVEMRAAPLPDAAGLVLAVSDSGPGIPPEELARIFEPFYTTKFSGTGLGLSVVRSLVEQHGGRVEVSSTPGQGTTFFVILPAQGSGAAPGAEV
jgi:signal transduction histidine kinase